MTSNPFVRAEMAPIFPIRLKQQPKPRNEQLRRDPFDHLSMREWWDLPTWHPAREETKR